MATSKASATWTGTLKEGSGSMKGASGKLEAPFTFATRFEGAAGGTTPEELIGAAQAGCFSMFLAAQLSAAGFPPQLIETSATVHLGAGPLIEKIELETVANVPGIDAKVFAEKVDFSKKNCPVSKALASVPTLTVNARLGSS
jgi:osmotically inducible protein OsmC